MIDEVKKLKAIACNFRLRILNLLISHKQGLYVCDMVHILDVQQYNISKHLSILKNADLVIDERMGKSVLYKYNFADNKLLTEFINKMKLEHYPMYQKDKKRLLKFSRI
jgi:ArsR family transcriptional regulator